MTLRRTAFAVAVVVGAIGLGLATGAYASQNSPSSTSKSSQALSVVVHPLKLLFVTSAGTSSSFPPDPFSQATACLEPTPSFGEAPRSESTMSFAR